MNVPSNYFILFDIVVIAIFILCIVISYKNGVIYESISLLAAVIAIFISYLVSPVLADSITIVKPSLDMTNTVDLSSIYRGINIVIWFLISFIIISFIFLIIKPLFKKITKIPVVGWINKLFGFIFGIIKGLILISLLSGILNFTIFDNYQEIREGTLIKYADLFTDRAIIFIAKNIDINEIENDVKNIDIDSARELIRDLLNK